MKKGKQTQSKQTQSKKSQKERMDVFPGDFLNFLISEIHLKVYHFTGSEVQKKRKQDFKDKFLKHYKDLVKKKEDQERKILEKEQQILKEAKEAAEAQSGADEEDSKDDTE